MAKGKGDNVGVKPNKFGVGVTPLGAGSASDGGGGGSSKPPSSGGGGGITVGCGVGCGIGCGVTIACSGGSSCIAKDEEEIIL